MSRIDQRLLDNQTVDETTGEMTPQPNAKDHTFTVTWGLGTTAGVVEIEAGPYAGYTGTWSNLTSLSWPAANQVDTARFTGPFKALRARISTVISTTDKGVTVDYSGV